MCKHNLKTLLDHHTTHNHPQGSTDSLNKDFDQCDYINLYEDILPAKTRHDLSYIHYNIRGLLSKQQQLSRLLHQLELKGNPIEIVSLNETWLRKDTETKVKIKNYQFVGKSRSGKKGGGVGFLLRNDLKFRERLDLCIASEVTEHYIIELKTESTNVILVSAYRPPNTTETSFLEDLKKTARQTKKGKQKHYHRHRSKHGPT